MADWEGSLGLEEWHSGKFPGLSFFPCIPDLADEEGNNLEMPIGADSKNPALFSQRIRKGASWQAENF